MARKKKKPQKKRRQRLGGGSVGRVYVVCSHATNNMSRINQGICKYYSENRTPGYEGCYGCGDWQVEDNLYRSTGRR